MCLTLVLFRNGTAAVAGAVNYPALVIGVGNIGVK